MNEMGEVLKKKRTNELNISIGELSRRSGISKSYLSLVENGQRNPKMDKLKQLSMAYEVEYDELLQLAGYIDEVPAGAVEIKRSYHIPVFGKISAGRPLLMNDVLEFRQILSIDENLNVDDYFYLRVSGDSMIGARIHDGDLVLVRKQQEVENGEIAVVSVNGEDATLKRVKKVNGMYMLFADNPAYEPIIIDNERAKIFGKVVKVEFTL